MRRIVNVYLYDILAGYLFQEDNMFHFSYLPAYKGPSLSLSLPNNGTVYSSEILPPFFHGLAPEGWLRKRYSETQKIDENDILGLLVENGNDLLGAVSLRLNDGI